MSTDTLRIAVVSTPRSGNTWLRRLLAQTLDLTELAVHLPTDVDWQSLPERFVLQIHWIPDEAFQALLAEHGFRVVVLSRHPLDLLISILVFSQHDASPAQWLGGPAGIERLLIGATPTSETFLSYATGPRAKSLLGVSAAWWQRNDVCRVRYEDLVRDTAGQLETILRSLGAQPRKPPAEVSAATTPKQMRALSVNHLYHVWHAQPGAWRRMLTAADARRICTTQPEVFDVLGYTCNPNESMPTAQAQVEWDRIGTEALQRTVHGVKGILAETELRQQRDYVQQRAETRALAERVEQLAVQTAEQFAAYAQTLHATGLQHAAHAEQFGAGLAQVRQEWRQIHATFGALQTAEEQRQAVETQRQLVEAERQAEIIDQRSALAALVAQAERIEHDLASSIEQRLAERCEQRLSEQAEQATRQYTAQRAELESVTRQLQQRDDQLERHRAELAALAHQVAGLPHEQLRTLGELGPWSLGVAHRLQRWSRRLPRVASAFKSLATLFRGGRPQVKRSPSSD